MTFEKLNNYGITASSTSRINNIYFRNQLQIECVTPYIIAKTSMMSARSSTYQAKHHHEPRSFSLLRVITQNV